MKINYFFFIAFLLLINSFFSPICAATIPGIKTQNKQASILNLANGIYYLTKQTIKQYIKKLLLPSK